MCCRLVALAAGARAIEVANEAAPCRPEPFATGRGRQPTCGEPQG